MKMQVQRRAGETILALSGDLDSHGAAQIRGEIDAVLRDPSVKKLTFDLKDVNFMDSSGIGLVIARANHLARRGGITRVIRPNPQTERVLRLSGVYQIVEGGEEA